MTHWILMPVRNGLHLTQKAVKTIIKQDLSEVRVLLIDNASLDGTAYWARSLYPFVVVIRKDPPLSVAQSWNKGLELLFDGSLAETVLVVNNDVELRPDTYRRLKEDGGGFVTAVSVSDREQMKTIDPRGVRPHPDFSCYLIRREVWDKVGRFDEGFKGAFFEDNDYHLRLHKAGVFAHCIDLPFYHVGSATINLMSDAEREQLQRQAALNGEYFEKKHGFKAASEEYYAAFKPSASGS